MKPLFIGAASLFVFLACVILVVSLYEIARMLVEIILT